MFFDDEVQQVEFQDNSEVQEVVAEQEHPVAQRTQDDSVSRNMRALREKSERAERERDEAIRRAQELESRMQKDSLPDEDDVKLGDDDIAEGKHLSKLTKKIKALESDLRQTKKQSAEDQQRSSMMATEARLKSQYPDFDKIVSSENIENLRSLYPEIASTLNSSTDLYATGVSAYTMIKKLGIHVEDAYQNEKAVAQKNAAKPKPLASVSPQQGDSPLSRANAFANGLTEDLKEQLRKEMFEARRAM